MPWQIPYKARTQPLIGSLVACMFVPIVTSWPDACSCGIDSAGSGRHSTSPCSWSLQRGQRNPSGQRTFSGQPHIALQSRKAARTQTRRGLDGTGSHCATSPDWYLRTRLRHQLALRGAQLDHQVDGCTTSPGSGHGAGRQRGSLTVRIAHAVAPPHCPDSSLLVGCLRVL